jgi:hypothetical protein
MTLMGRSGTIPGEPGRSMRRMSGRQGTVTRAVPIFTGSVLPLSLSHRR